MKKFILTLLLVFSIVPSMSYGAGTVTDEGNLDCDSDPSDPDVGDTLTYCWDIGNNGSCESTAQDVDPLSIAGLGYEPGDVINVCFTVTDQGGLSSKSCVEIQVTPSGEDEVEITKIFGMNTGNDFAFGDDTQIKQDFPTTNFNSYTNISVKKAVSSDARKMLLSWSLASLDESTIDATIAKLRLYKDSGPNSGTATVTVKAAAAFTPGGVTWNTYGGDGVTYGTVGVSSSDPAGTAYDITLNAAGLAAVNTAIDANGTFSLSVSDISTSYFGTYTEENGTYQRAPELHVTYMEDPTPEVPPVCSWYLVSPVAGSAANEGDEIILAHTCDQAITFAVVGDKDLRVIAETEDTDMELLIDSATATVSRTHYYVGTVAAGQVSADLTLKDNFSRTGDTLKWGAGATELSYNFTGSAMGISIDTTPPASITTTEVCNAEGTSVEADVTITSDSTIPYFALKFPEPVWFVGGSLADLPVICEGLTYGSLTLSYFGSQPANWGVGTVYWLYGGTVEDGTRGIANLPAAIVPIGTVKIVDKTVENELMSYALNNNFKWIFADPRDWLIPADFASMTAFIADAVNAVPNDFFTISTAITEAAAVDLSDSNGTDGNPITIIGATGGVGELTIPGAGLTLGNYYIVKDLVMKGAFTPGPNNSVKSILHMTGQLNITQPDVAILGSTILVAVNATAAAAPINSIFDGEVTITEGITWTPSYCLFAQTEAELESGGGIVTPGAGCIFGRKARFVNPAGSTSIDFKLRPNSPAVDAGSDLSGQGIITDLFGKAKPQYNAHDIGCNELAAKFGMAHN